MRKMNLLKTVEKLNVENLENYAVRIGKAIALYQWQIEYENKDNDEDKTDELIRISDNIEQLCYILDFSRNKSSNEVSSLIEEFRVDINDFQKKYGQLSKLIC